MTVATYGRGVLARLARIAALVVLGQSPALPAAETGLPARTLADLQWSDDGATLVGVADKESRGAFFQAYDGGTGRPAWRVALDGLRAPGSGRRLVVERWQPSSVAGELLVESGGDLYLVRSTGSPAVRQLTRTKSRETDARLAPDGGRVAFVRDGDLWSIELEDGRERRLTDDGRPPAIVNGVRAEPTAEPFAGGNAFAWAPDARTVAFLRRDPSGVVLRLVSTITPGALDVDAGVPAAGTLEEVQWRFDARALAVERRSADGKRLELLLCSAERLRCRKLAERATTVAASRRDIWFFATGFVWSSAAPQRDELAFFDTVGRERHLLETGDWVPDRLEAADEPTGAVLARASRAGSGGTREIGLLRLSVAPGAAARVLAGEGDAELLVSPSGAAFVVTSSARDAVRRRELRGPDGKAIAALPPPPVGD